MSGKAGRRSRCSLVMALALDVPSSSIVCCTLGRSCIVAACQEVTCAQLLYALRFDCRREPLVVAVAVVYSRLRCLELVVKMTVMLSLWSVHVITCSDSVRTFVARAPTLVQTRGRPTQQAFKPCAGFESRHLQTLSMASAFHLMPQALCG
eukprot:2445594-Amphidinium_carterae.1